jgi:hydroxymethylpyrimidine pyrophosphatase-like HAD family hydrolase
MSDCVKIVVNCIDEKEKERIVQLVKDNIDVHIYASRTHVNIIEKSVNKEHALKRLFNIENLDYNKLYVIGDNDNDYEMLKTFNGAVIKEHHTKLNELKKEEYNELNEYIDKLLH